MTEKEYIHAGNIKALAIAAYALRSMLVIDEDFPTVIDDKPRPEFPNFNRAEFDRVYTTIRYWHETLIYHMNDLEEDS